jgi:BirA family transcriptional regulator, biotin operon repressor / biotin---[acetyl-CoA-carboxylase] ligase
MCLSTDRAVRPAFGIVELDEVDSTNAEALRRADIVARPTWVFAHRQTAARGRRGRAWITDPGNFAGTLLIRPDCPPREAAQYSFVAALALRDSLAGFASASAIGLKWPNDVLLNGGKVAGILLETTGLAGRIGSLAIGIGVNLSSAPDSAHVEPGATAPVCLRGETGADIAPRAFLDVLAAAFASVDQFRARHGFQGIRDLWLAGAMRRGETITARTMTESVEGVFQAIDDTGALVLMTPAGRRTIPAADVFF